MKKFHQQRKGSTDTSKDQLIIYGRHAVISALKIRAVKSKSC